MSGREGKGSEFIVGMARITDYKGITPAKRPLPSLRIMPIIRCRQLLSGGNMLLGCWAG
jgi:hypothetical protein